MYVTDVPIVDRLADDFASEVAKALYALETALADLDGWVDESAPEGDKRPKYGPIPTPADVYTGLTTALEAAYVAHEHMTEALSRFTIPPL